MNLAAANNWLHSTTKLIHFCQMLIQGMMVTDSNVLTLPKMNSDTYNNLIDKLVKAKVLNRTQQDLTIPIIRFFMQDKEMSSKISGVFQEVVGHKTATDIMKLINDFPILTVKTSLKNIQNSQSIPVNQHELDKQLELQSGGDYVFSWDIIREGSSKMTVYSKKFNKQKEEFWFLILVEGDNITFRKFAFSRRNKKIEIPVHIPSARGNSQLIGLLCNNLICFQVLTITKYWL